VLRGQYVHGFDGVLGGRNVSGVRSADATVLHGRHVHGHCDVHGWDLHGHGVRRHRFAVLHDGPEVHGRRLLRHDVEHMHDDLHCADDDLRRRDVLREPADRLESLRHVRNALHGRSNVHGRRVHVTAERRARITARANPSRTT
jgi:hypothetical protein